MDRKYIFPFGWNTFLRYNDWVGGDSDDHLHPARDFKMAKMTTTIIGRWVYGCSIEPQSITLIALSAYASAFLPVWDELEAFRPGAHNNSKLSLLILLFLQKEASEAP